ncbi:hypothetical protein V492_04374 [Pseudogymnoascus sp. VKM F-4246]|nr:hypothetical protein V492_04374 [Pseudogymnoascus sp. VKM F-4246]
MGKCALWGVMLNLDVFDKLSPSGESIAVPGATLDWAAMWATPFMQGYGVHLEIFDSIERLLGRTSMNLASAGLDIVHEMRMSSFDVVVKFIFAWISSGATRATRIRALEFAFLRMGL